jgi:hypothetical protein
MQIHWKPTAKQEQALARTEFEVLYGGARGGGKTDAGMVYPLYHIDNPRFRALVIRRNAEDLKDWTDRARVMYAPLKATSVGNPPEFRFPSGAVIRTGHLRDENAYEKYQGHEYQNIILEELTQIPSEESYLRLISSCRSTITDLPPQVFATTNPGGPGHNWVKKRFIDVGPEGIPFIDDATGRARIFISAKVQDNPHLMEKDPGYVAFLNSLPDGVREAWRDGDWESFEEKGAYYADEIAQARKDGRVTRVLYEPNLPVVTAWDIGMNDTTSIGFFQIFGNEKRMIDYVEDHGKGFEHYVKILNSKDYIYSKHLFPFDIEVKEMGTGKTRREVLEVMGIEVTVVPRLNINDGIQAVRSIFPTLWLDSVNCSKFIESIQQYRQEWDDDLQTYKNKPLHDWTSHAADMIRYFAIGLEQLSINTRNRHSHYRPDYARSRYNR